MVTRRKTFTSSSGELLVLLTRQDLDSSGSKWHIELELRKPKFLGSKLIERRSVEKSSSWETSLLKLLIAHEESQLLLDHGLEISALELSRIPPKKDLTE